MSSLLNGVRDFVTADTDRSEVLIALFVSSFFINKFSHLSLKKGLKEDENC